MLNMSNWLEIQHCKKCVHGLGYVQYTCHTETHCWRPISTVVFLVDFVCNNWRLHCAPSTCIRVSCWSPGCGVAPCQWTGTLHPAGPRHGPSQAAWVSDVRCSHIQIQILGLPRIRAAPPPPQRQHRRDKHSKAIQTMERPSPAHDVWCGWVTVDNMDGAELRWHPIKCNITANPYYL